MSRKHAQPLKEFGKLHYVHHPQPQAAHESTPHTTLGTGDASLEEVLHLIQNGAYGPVYRDLEPGIGSGYNLLHDAMDVARGVRYLDAKLRPLYNL